MACCGRGKNTSEPVMTVPPIPAELIAVHSQTGTPPTRLAVIAVRYNPLKWIAPERNYERFAEGIRNDGVDLFTLRLDYETDAVESTVITGGDGTPLNVTWTIRASKSRHLLWQKEAAINAAVMRLQREFPKQYDAVAWIDADLIFENRDWPQRTLEALAESNMVQLFDTVVRQNPDGTVESRYPGACAAFLKTLGTGYDIRNPGGAWACRLSTWNDMGGLFPWDYFGGGDNTAFAVFRGASILSRMPDGEPLVRAWRVKAHTAIRRKVSHLRGAVIHLYHGSIVNRRYRERWRDPQVQAITASEDLEIGEHGLLQWREGVCDCKRDAITRYFKRREEDDKEEPEDAEYVPIVDPFEGDPVTHLVAHLYPLKKAREVWTDHIARWKRIASEINGKVMIGVALSEETESLDTVRSMLPDSWDVVSFDNVKEGENQTFREAQARIPTGPDDVWIYCHSKGVTRLGNESVKLWVDELYTQVAYRHKEAVEILASGYKACGAFRATIDDERKNPRGWLFSGTFFVVRAKYMAGKKVPAFYGGVEHLFGNIWDREEAYCMAHDDRRPGQEYEIEEMRKIIPAKKSQRVSIIITVGPGMSRYLPDALASAKDQSDSEVIVVFDNDPPSETGTKTVVVTHGNVQLSRRSGMEISVGEAILFLDADNRLPVSFVSNALETLDCESKADPTVAGVYPSITYYDEQWTPTGGRLDAPEWDAELFKRANYVDASSLVWRHALDMSWRNTTSHDRLEDHHMWSQLVDDGWTMRPANVDLEYRRRSASMTAVEHSQLYVTRYALDEKPITVFVPFARSRYVDRLCDWLDTLPQRCRLVMCESGADDELYLKLRQRAASSPLSDVRVYRHEVAQQGLADNDRAKHERAVQYAVGAIYNRFAVECGTDMALIIEDDILPHLDPHTLICNLLNGFDETTAAVTGSYNSRFTGKSSAFKGGFGTRQKWITQRDIDRSGEEYIPVTGCGFGCLMIRSSALRSVPQSVTIDEPWYDPRFFRLLTESTGLKIKLSRRATCDHGDLMEGVAFDYGGTLETHPELRDEVARLNAKGVPVFAISAVSGDEWIDTRIGEIKALKSTAGVTLTFKEIVVFVHAAHSDSEGNTTEQLAGRRKAAEMRRLGAAVLHDDNGVICREVRQAGLIAIQAINEVKK